MDEATVAVIAPRRLFPIVVALALRSVARRAGPGAPRSLAGSRDGLAAVMRLAGVAVR